MDDGCAKVSAAIQLIVSLKLIAVNPSREKIECIVAAPIILRHPINSITDSRPHAPALNISQNAEQLFGYLVIVPVKKYSLPFVFNVFVSFDRLQEKNTIRSSMQIT